MLVALVHLHDADKVINENDESRRSSLRYPQTHIQLCIIHMVRNSLKYVSWKDYKAVTSGLKMVYQAPTEEAALMALEKFAGVWDEKYPQISKSWRTH